MSNIESTPNLNVSEITSNKVEAISDTDAEKETEKEPTAEDTLELSSGEEETEQIEKDIDFKQEEISRLSESIENTKSAINSARNELGLSSTDEDAPSVFNNIDQIEKLENEKKELGKKKEDIVSQKEKDRLIEEEKGKILQEKLDEIFEEFELLNDKDIESISANGKTLDGSNVESKSIGSVDPKIAQHLAKAFNAGIKLSPKILEVLPDFLKRIDDDITNEAVERIEQKLKDLTMENKEDGILSDNDKEETKESEIEKREEAPKDTPKEEPKTEGKKD